MTMLDFLQAHTLDEILENDKILLILDDSIDERRHDYFDLRGCVIENDLFFRADACEAISCSHYESHYDQYDYELSGYCNLVYDHAIKNGWDGSPDTYIDFVKPINCPYQHEHIKYIKNNVKKFLLKELES